MSPTDARRFNSGLCLACGKVPPVTGGLRCRSCLDKRSSSAKELYRSRREEGVCRDCHKKIDENGTKIQCFSCRMKNNERLKKRRFERKLRVFSAYGGKCSCCGEPNHMFLSIDHIKNDGSKHRKEVKPEVFYSWLENKGFPKDRFQLLCHNCNFGKRLNNGVCPHKTEGVKHG